MSRFTPLGSLLEGSVAVLSPERLDATRARLEAALDRLEGLHGEMQRRASLLTSGLARLETLRQEFIAQLDAMTPDPDLEPSYAGAYGWTRGSDDEREPDADDEYSCGWSESESLNGRTALAQGSAEAESDAEGEPSLGWSEQSSLTGRVEHFAADDHEHWLGASSAIDQRGWATDQPAHLRAYEAEEQCEDEGMSGALDPDREPDTDAEPDQDHACWWQDEGDQTNLRRVPVFLTPRVRDLHTNVGPFIPVRAL